MFDLSGLAIDHHQSGLVPVLCRMESDQLLR